MPAYNFMRQFVPAVWLGLHGSLEGLPIHLWPDDWGPVTPKYRTMRDYRKDGRHATEGSIVHCYWGQRSKHCVKLGMAVGLGHVPVKLDFIRNRVRVDGHYLERGAVHLDRFARQDGFPDGWEALKAHWQKTRGVDLLRWDGVLVRWRRS